MIYGPAGLAKLIIDLNSDQEELVKKASPDMRMVICERYDKVIDAIEELETLVKE